MRRLSAPCRFLELLALTVATVTCDRAPTALTHAHTVLTLRPQFASSLQSAGSFGLNIDNVRVEVLRGESTVLKDTTVVFPASATEVDISLEVPLDASSVDASVTIQLRQRTTTYFGGSQPVTLQAGQSTQPVTVPIAYVGPGQNVASLTITASATSVIAPTTDTLHANAVDANKAVVTDVPIAWSVSDSTVATIAANGVSATLTPTGKRGSITVSAATPTGVSATSSSIGILPSASKLTVITGTGQSAVVGSVLAQAFQVRVDGADNLPVPGVTVQFQSTTTGGSATPASAVSDTNGLAATSMKLGTIAGPYVFQASGSGIPAVIISATALAGAPASIAATAGSLQTAIAGTVLSIAPTVVVKDATGNPISGIGVTFTASPSSGAVSTSTTFTTSVTANTDASGTAKVNWKIGALEGADTLTVSVGTLPPILFTASGTPAPYSDDFEAAALNSFWSTTVKYGSITQSTDQHHSGTQSLLFASTQAPSTDGPGMNLTHTFAVPTKGKFSIWFYDVAPGQQTLYEMMSLFNSAQPNAVASIGTQDYDAYCYEASHTDAANVLHGPNSTCPNEASPGVTTTSAARTLGWHQLVIDVQANALVYSIDGIQVYSEAGDFTFDRVTISIGGPYWRPLTTAYFDDFSFTP